ncbi:hypothetical protein HRbin40_02602 [bacterium HR40]|nr:hypothetical protein HRbin40_02602 [bacterium HR40]
MDKLARIASAIETLQERLGRFVCWLLLAVAGLGFVIAVLRYALGTGAVWLQESQLWLHGTVFMLAAGWTLLHDRHVRVDIWYRSASPAARAVTDLCGTLFLLWPMCLTLLWTSFPWLRASWQRLEGSREAGGLPGLFLLKSLVPAFALLLALAGLVRVLRALGTLRGRLPGDGSPRS